MTAARAIRTIFATVVLMLSVPIAAHASTFHELAQLLSKGLYDEAIEKCTQWLEAYPEANGRLRYLRGRAYHGIGWFGSAEEDLAPLGDFAPWPNWPPASEMVAKIAEMRRLAPEHVKEIKSGNRVLFRVYYDEDNAWTRALIAMLPDAWRKVGNFYKVDLDETAVFIFGDAARYNAFFRTWSGRFAKHWQWAGGESGVLIFCQRDPSGATLAKAGSDYFRGTALHEYSHLVCRRVLGHAPIPPWLSEGMASVCGALAAPQDIIQNDRDVLRIAAEGQWLPLEAMTDRDRFYANETSNLAYTQSFAMTRYLISQVGEAKVIQLLNLLASEANPDAAFKKALGMEQAQFYELWLHAPS